MMDDKLPPEWDWEPEKLTLSQMLRRDLFPRWEWIIRADPDPIQQENQMLAEMVQTGKLPEIHTEKQPTDISDTEDGGKS
ncbi:hypothetical protein [Effusibacillus consociatus]|uniref:Uncharacterized protein n=1 Tax=Effusibacillus consociatus TaxID=1117041 RepID=A0ABV9PZD7_9BACL